MIINSTNELLEYIDIYSKKEKDLIKEEELILNKLKYISFLSRKSKDLKKEASNLRNKIIEANVIVKHCYNFFEKYSTINNQLLFNLLTTFLTEIENEEYVLIEDIEEINYPFSLITKELELSFLNNHFNIITTLENQKKLNSYSKVYGEEGIDDINEYLSICNDNRYICLESDDNYSLLSGKNLSIDFKNYPYLKDVAYQLVDLKLSNPNITDEERIHVVLQKSSVKTLQIK